ncbi:MAG: DUF4382 domain-containing protein [Bacteroidia bacterium]|nr:DUF4382 domain-containing protein [Bacteroidia bacterium]
MKRSGLVILIFIYVIFILTIILMGCSSDKNETKPMNGSVVVKLTDAPVNYNRVNIEILSVKICYADKMKWVALETKKGIYNLLDFQNGLSVMLANATQIPTGRINGICLETGNWNSVEIDHVNYPVMLDESRKGKIHIPVEARIVSGLTTSFIFDFDAKKSLRSAGTKEFILNPVIEVKQVQYQ